MPSDGKIVADSTVERALFQESPPRVETESLAESTAQSEVPNIGLALVANLGPSPVSDDTTVEEKTTTRRRPSSQKNQTDAPSKKKKT